MNEAKQLIQDFSDLYSGKITNFRGARHYDNKVQNEEVKLARDEIYHAN